MATFKFKSINEFVDSARAGCLNAKAGHQTVAAVFGKENGHLESEDDGELLLQIPFTQPVKIGGLRILGLPAEEASETSAGPREVKLFTNQPNMSFADAESDEATQIVEFDEAAVKEGGEAIELRFVKFQAVTHLTIFVATNWGGDVTKVKEIELFGAGAEDMKMSEWKKPDKSQLRSRED